MILRHLFHHSLAIVIHLMRIIIKSVMELCFSIQRMGTLNLQLHIHSHQYVPYFSDGMITFC